MAKRRELLKIWIEIVVVFKRRIVVVEVLYLKILKISVIGS